MPYLGSNALGITAPLRHVPPGDIDHDFYRPRNRAAPP